MVPEFWGKQPWTIFLSVYVKKLNILSKSRYNVDLILVVYYISAGNESLHWIASMFIYLENSSKKIRTLIG